MTAPVIRRWLHMCAPGILLGAALLAFGVGWLTASSALLFLLLGASLLMVGVLFPATEVYAPCLSRVPGQRVALTFDDGPHPVTTRRVLLLLAEHDQRATFFVIGRKVEAYPDVVREIADRGHAIGVHGFDHDWLHAFKLPQQVEADIRKSQDAVRRASGVTPTLFRPPLGLLSPFTAEGARRAGVHIVGWSFRLFDGLPGRPTSHVLRSVERRLRAGDVVLLHDASESERFTPAGVVVLPQVLALVRSRGLRSTPLPLADLN
jgi:peptidoglycan/xylan/chitin deacetylase (PgdA/CDA1 family)